MNSVLQICLYYKTCTIAVAHPFLLKESELKKMTSIIGSCFTRIYSIFFSNSLYIGVKMIFTDFLPSIFFNSDKLARLQRFLLLDTHFIHKFEVWGPWKVPGMWHSLFNPNLYVDYGNMIHFAVTALASEMVNFAHVQPALLARSSYSKINHISIIYI